MQQVMSIAVLDDYQRVAAANADWSRLDLPVRFFHDHLAESSALIERLESFDVIVAMRERTPFPRALLQSLPRLRLLVTTGMRNGTIDLTAAAELGINVCGTRSPAHATAELAFALIQLLSRGLLDEVQSVRSGGWQAGVGSDLRGAVLGVLGLGRLGSQVARFGIAFGMKVIAWSKNLNDHHALEIGVEPVPRRRLFKDSDFVTIHLRLSDRTRGLVGSRELSLMRSGAYLINTSRGPIVDEDALLRAVRSRSIAGAALDAYAQEPLPPDHPFRSEPRIITTPHIGYVTRETYRVFYGDALEDIEAWLSGTPVRLIAPGKLAPRGTRNDLSRLKCGDRDPGKREA